MPPPLDQLVLDLDGHLLYWGVAALVLGVIYLALPSGDDLTLDDTRDGGESGGDGE